MRHGIIILPQQPWSEARLLWQRAEELGFDTAWIYDHLSWRSLADEPWAATVPTLTAAATATTTIGLGTLVSSPNFRHPVPFAKEIATIDQISGGRLRIGVGSGGTGFDADVLGVPPLSARKRHERFDEFVRSLDLLLRFEEPTSGGIDFAGEWYTAVSARMVRGEDQPPKTPLLVAAEGPKGMALAARYGEGWITSGPPAETEAQWWRGVRTSIDRLEETASAAGRDPATIERYLSVDAADRYSLRSVAAYEDAAGRAEALRFTELVSHWPRPDGIFAGEEAVLTEVASRFAS